MICKSKGCTNETRMRPFKGSHKHYSEGTCRACQGTQRRWGMTKPEREEYKASVKNRQKISLKDYFND